MHCRRMYIKGGSGLQPPLKPRDGKEPHLSGPGSAFTILPDSVSDTDSDSDSDTESD